MRARAPMGGEIPRIDPVPEQVARPRWSVMIPTYDCAAYLRRTLESVLAQDTGTDAMQIEVVDDCSTRDDPERVVVEVGAGRIAFFRKARNEGPTRTFNTCLQRARGHLVHILHGDDYVLPGFYRVVQDAAEQYPDLASFYVRALVVDAAGSLETISPRVPSLERGGRDPSPLYYGNLFQTPAAVVRRSFYERHGGFDPRLVHVADWEIWVRAIHHGGGLAINEPLAAYRQFDGNHTSQVVRTGEAIRDHMRMATAWEAAGLSWFSLERFRARMAATAAERVQWFTAIGDRESAARNREVWREISSAREKLEYFSRRAVAGMQRRKA